MIAAKGPVPSRALGISRSHLNFVHVPRLCSWSEPESGASQAEMRPLKIDVRILSLCGIQCRMIRVLSCAFMLVLSWGQADTTSLTMILPVLQSGLFPTRNPQIQGLSLQQYFALRW